MLRGVTRIFRQYFGRTYDLDNHQALNVQTQQQIKQYFDARWKSYCDFNKTMAFHSQNEMLTKEQFCEILKEEEPELRSEQEVGVHLIPYDRKKFQTPMKHIKTNSVYALLDIDPFPRATIMKSCYHLLDMLQKKIPPTAYYRVKMEARVKFIMKMTDKHEDVRELELLFRTDSIELFISALNKEQEVLNIVAQQKLWEQDTSEAWDPTLGDQLMSRQVPKFTVEYAKARDSQKFVD